MCFENNTDMEQPSVGDKTTGTGTSVFSKDGAIGSMFKGWFSPLLGYLIYKIATDCWNLADGAVGGTAQSIGGPLDKTGMIGKNFKEDGAIGGMIQKNLAEKK